MNNELETVLDICLNQIKDGESDIEECLALYPEQAAQLEPLLKAATKLSRAREVIPDPVYKARARAQLSTYMQQNPQRKRVSPIFWRVAIGVMTMLVAFLATGTSFAQSALPGDRLYDWKLTSENVWRMTSNDQLGVDITLSNRRVSELVVVSGDQMRQARALENYKKLLVKFNATENAKDRARILPVLRVQHKSLTKAGVSIPPELEALFPH
jgi:hypothetical protein